MSNVIVFFLILLFFSFFIVYALVAGIVELCYIFFDTMKEYFLILIDCLGKGN